MALTTENPAVHTAPSIFRKNKVNLQWKLKPMQG